MEERIKEFMQLTKCDSADVDHFVITPIDDCYRNARIAVNETFKVSKILGQICLNKKGYLKTSSFRGRKGFRRKSKTVG